MDRLNEWADDWWACEWAAAELQLSQELLELVRGIEPRTCSLRVSTQLHPPASITIRVEVVDGDTDPTIGDDD